MIPVMPDAAIGPDDYRQEYEMADVTQAKLKSVLRYCKDSGDFFWINDVRAGKGLGRLVIKAGTIAGHTTKAGYRSISIDGREYMAHRLAWLYVHGTLGLAWPKFHIDHINGVKDDNRIDNIRLVTNSQNAGNQHRAQSCSKTGLLGASPAKGGKFVAQIAVDGLKMNLGRYDTAEEAHKAYLLARSILRHL